MREVRGYCWEYMGSGRIDTKFMLPFDETELCGSIGFWGSI